MKFNTRAWSIGLLTAALAVVAIVVVNAQPRTRPAPYDSSHFALEIDGQAIGLLRSVEGGAIETEVIEYQQGGNPDLIHKVAGPTRFANIRLTRVFTGDRSLYDWFRATKKPDPVRVDGRIIMFDRQGTEIASWKFVNGFPVKWEGPQFDATKNEVAIETLEIAHEGLILLPENDGNKG